MWEGKRRFVEQRQKIHAVSVVESIPLGKHATFRGGGGGGGLRGNNISEEVGQVPIHVISVDVSGMIKLWATPEINGSREKANWRVHGFYQAGRGDALVKEDSMPSLGSSHWNKGPTGTKEGRITAMALSPEEELLAVAVGSGRVEVIRLELALAMETGRENLKPEFRLLYRTRLHGESITALSFSSLGGRLVLASSSLDRTVRIGALAPNGYFGIHCFQCRERVSHMSLASHTITLTLILTLTLGDAHVFGEPHGDDGEKQTEA